jgi:hypothetical protein
VAIRQSVDESFVVSGDREEWLDRACDALERQRFTKVRVSESLYQIEANYKKMTTWGDIQITLTPVGDTETRLDVTATAGVDNIFALFRSPGRKIISEFKSGL